MVVVLVAFDSVSVPHKGADLLSLSLSLSLSSYIRGVAVDCSSVII